MFPSSKVGFREDRIQSKNRILRDFTLETITSDVGEIRTIYREFFSGQKRKDVGCTEDLPRINFSLE